MGNYVYSTLTSNVEYVVWEFNPSRDVARVKHSVVIKGGTGVAERRTFITPKGAVTCVTDEQLTLLKGNRIFNRHVERGFIKIESSERKVEKAIRDMAPKDKSSPKTPEDYKNDGLNVTTENRQVVVENPNKK